MFFLLLGLIIPFVYFFFFLSDINSPPYDYECSPLLPPIYGDFRHPLTTVAPVALLVGCAVSVAEWHLPPCPAHHKGRVARSHAYTAGVRTAVHYASDPKQIQQQENFAPLAIQLIKQHGNQNIVSTWSYCETYIVIFIIEVYAAIYRLIFLL